MSKKVKQTPAAFYNHGQEFVKKLFDRDGFIKITNDAVGDISSISPAESLFGYTYHAHMIPPYKPSEILIIGYGQGTIASLIRKVWDRVQITGVDAEAQDWPYVEHKLLVCDAYDFVKECTNSIIKKRYDYIVVDLLHNGKVPDFIYSAEFATRLYSMTKTLMSINTPASEFSKLKCFYDYGFKFHRHVQIFSNTVSFWGI